jgi:hypothetical protein
VKSFLLLIFAVVSGLVVVNRHQLYVRDPLARVYKNGLEQSGVQVFITYSDDVLVQLDTYPIAHRVLVQSWNMVPERPLSLVCIRWIACLTDARHPTSYPIELSGGGKYDPKTTMTSREVTFVDGDGATLRIVLH